MTKQEKVLEILKRLYRVWPDPKTELKHSNALELLVATIMSAQTTDKLVNALTPKVFNKFKTAKDYADSTIEEIAMYIKPVNYYGTKAKHVKEMAKILVEKHNGQVPDNMEDLVQLPGVGRKTANVILSNIYNKAEGITVDTHVKRLSQRLGLTDKNDPVKIEQDLMQIVPKDKWGDFSHLIILYGRYYCPAKPHVCRDCPLGELCPDIS